MVSNILKNNLVHESPEASLISCLEYNQRSGITGSKAMQMFRDPINIGRLLSRTLAPIYILTCAFRDAAFRFVPTFGFRMFLIFANLFH